MMLRSACSNSKLSIMEMVTHYTPENCTVYIMPLNCSLHFISMHFTLTYLDQVSATKNGSLNPPPPIMLLVCTHLKILIHCELGNTSKF